MLGNVGDEDSAALTMERSRGPGKIGRDASAISASRVARISHEILRDLGMSDEAIAHYFLSLSTCSIGAVHASGYA